MRWMAILACWAGLAPLGLCGAEDPAAESIPKTLRASLEALPPEARPEALQRARNGALYALLPNGAELIVKEKRSAPVVSLQIWVRTGAIHEREFLGAGLSHFAEHLLFKGTAKRPTGALDQEIRGAGGDDNAYTTGERTVYHVTCESSGFETALDALADMVMNSTFPPEEVKKEHGVVTKEIERAQDNPEERLYEAFVRCRYQVHPYRVPVLGYPARFQQVTREEVWNYYKRRYAPQATAAIVVGDVDPAKALSLLARTLGPWKRSNHDEQEIPAEPPQVAPREVRITHPLCQVPRLLLGFPSVRLRHPDLFALDVLASVLGDGRASRLYREVKDARGLALEIGCYNDTPLHEGTFTVWANLEEAQIAKGKAAILDCLASARQQKPDQEELARAKRKVQARHIFDQMTAEGVAGALGSDWFVAGDLDFSQTYVERIAAVTAEEVLAAAQKYLDPQRLNVALLTPEARAGQEAGAGGLAQAAGSQPPAASDAAALETQRKAILAGLAGRPELSAAQAQPTATSGPGETRWVVELELTSGLRVVIREDHSLPAVHVALVALGGQRWEPAELAGAGNLLAEMLDHGTAKRSQARIAEEVENKGASLSTFGGRNTFGIGLRCLKEDLAPLMELASDCLLNPSFPEAELEKVRREALALIAEQDEELFVVNSKILRPLLYGSHPYSRPVLGKAESVSRLSAADLAKLHASWIQPSNLALAFVGDVRPAEALDLVLKSCGTLKDQAKARPAVVAVPALSGVREEAKVLEKIQGTVLTVGFPGVKLGDPDREVLDTAASLLSGLGGRLYNVIREKLGAAYSVGVSNEVQLDGGAFIFFIQTDAEKLARCQEAIQEEVRKLREEPVPEAELATIKRYLEGQEAISQQDQGDLAQRLALSQLYREGARSVFTRAARFSRVTAAQIQAAARKYLDPKTCAKAIVRPTETDPGK